MLTIWNSWCCSTHTYCSLCRKCSLFSTAQSSIQPCRLWLQVWCASWSNFFLFPIFPRYAHVTLHFDIYPGLVTTGWATGCRLKGQSPFTLSLPITHTKRPAVERELKGNARWADEGSLCVFNMSHPCPASSPGYSFYKDVKTAPLLPPLPAQKWNNSTPLHCIFVPFVQNGEAEKKPHNIPGAV